MSFRRTSHFSLILLFFCLALVGVALVPLLPVKLAPSRALPQLTVSYQKSDYSARSIETEITCKMEAMLARVKGIKQIESSSSNGHGTVTISLDKHTSIDMARFEVASVIRQLYPELPEGVSYPTLTLTGVDEKSNRPFMTYTINAPANPSIIQRYTEENIKTILSSLKGINKIEVYGATPMEWQLEYDSDQLSSLGIRVDDIQESIRNYYASGFVGTASVAVGDGTVRRLSLLLTPSEREKDTFDPSRIAIRTKEGQFIRLDRIVKALYTVSKPTSFYRINGLNSIYMTIYADDSVNQLELSSRVVQQMESIRLQLPAGYEVYVGYDATEYIRKELNSIYVRTGLTVLILLLFVLLITLNFRYLLMIVLSLTVNIAVAVIFYTLFRLEIQLYSLAGITISLSLIIDNTIVMSDHLMRKGNIKVFLSILAATLTTVGALVIIFFLDEKIRLNLQDFAAIVIINLLVSLTIALFFVPSLVDRLHISRPKGMSRRRLPRFLKRVVVRFNRIHHWQIAFLLRRRWIAFVLLILMFGLPLFLLPEKLEGEGRWIERYNAVVGSSVYKEKIKPITEKLLGGSLRLFAEKVYSGSYFTRKEETVLLINANQPNGTTLEQMNSLVRRMEHFLQQFSEIKQFQTSIYSPLRASLQVYFTPEAERSDFPYILKSKVISRALELGGGSWGVYGLEDQGFSNDVRESAGSFRVEMLGYNYDDLYKWAEQLKSQLLTNRRIKEVLISSLFSYWKDDYREFYFDINSRQLAEANLSPIDLYSSLQSLYGRDRLVGNVSTEGQPVQIKLTSRQSQTYDVWNLLETLQRQGSVPYKLSAVTQVEKGQMPQEIRRINQQYRLCLQYEYIGLQEQGSKTLTQILDKFTKLLPMGYSAKQQSAMWNWGKDDSRQYLLLLLIIVIIYFISSILFNSLKQAFAIVFVIPISFIGVFLSFYLFGVNFDQGGFASLILLCGITVNSSIYLVSEYNDLRANRPLLNPMRAYTRAWNIKVTPILLTIISTVLGFTPFILGESKEAFWFPLAVGTIGGLFTSFLGIYLYLSLFILPRQIDRRS